MATETLERGILSSLGRGYNHTQMSDHYGVLGISRSASPAEVKHAYRELARRYHPDTAREPDEDRFAEVHAAYETLGDARTRRAYDETLPSVSLAPRIGAVLAAPAAPPPRVEPPRPAGTSRWRLARALEAYLAEPRPPALAVDVLAW